MSFAYLKEERMKAVRKAFMGRGREYEPAIRSLVMADIAPEYVQRLRLFDSNFQQLAGDLDSLNRRQKLSNGTVPLELWLIKAKEVVFSGLPEEEIIQAALNELKTPADTGESTAIIIDGLDAFIDLVKTNRDAYSAVIYYRKTFETALWEIDRIANYKRLHDELHKVQLNWPDAGVVTVLLSSKDEDTVKDTLLGYSAALNNTCAELRETYENGFVDGAEHAWIEQLEGYQSDLEKVLNGEVAGLDHEPTTEEIKEATKNAFAVIKELLTSKLSKLNERLKESINKLHLADLIKAMNEVCEQVTRLSAHTLEQIQQYKTGVTELSNLDALLKALIEQHDSWQRADNLLRNLGETLKRGIQKGEARTTVQEAERLTNLKFIKAIIDNSVTPLLQGRTTFWSTRLLAAAEKFSKELERSEADRAQHAFDNYREQAWNFFFEIDSEMKRRCEELRTIGQKLRKINDQLKFNDDLDL